MCGGRASPPAARLECVCLGAERDWVLSTCWGIAALVVQLCEYKESHRPSPLSQAAVEGPFFSQRSVSSLALVIGRPGQVKSSQIYL